MTPYEKKILRRETKRLKREINDLESLPKAGAALTAFVSPIVILSVNPTISLGYVFIMSAVLVSLAWWGLYRLMLDDLNELKEKRTALKRNLKYDAPS